MAHTEQHCRRLADSRPHSGNGRRHASNPPHSGDSKHRRNRSRECTSFSRSQFPKRSLWLIASVDLRSAKARQLQFSVALCRCASQAVAVLCESVPLCERSGRSSLCLCASVPLCEPSRCSSLWLRASVRAKQSQLVEPRVEPGSSFPTTERARHYRWPDTRDVFVSSPLHRPSPRPVTCPIRLPQPARSRG